ncbi:MAG: DUF2911 domain-containing protein [Planctomycetes bacterium]|nr:DUF2911 domain-containing protein [Planctomycetota bacterium]
MMRFPFAVAALAALSFAPITAQQVFGGPDEDRQSSTVLVFGQEVMAAASISYSQPTWKDSYDQRFDELKGRKLRLGKNWWTTLQTATPLEIAGQSLDAGAYVLGLECDEKGNFSLLAMAADWAMKNKVLPWSTDNWRNEIKIPLALAKGSLEEPVEKMEIEISAERESPMSGKFSIRWGKHELSAKVNYAPKPVTDASAGKSDEETGEDK